ncbi:hypothetical protein GIB67_026494 [Kingdonia uniflora]|uniref:Translocation protein SEC62 n=1 Tax=Kingdonia uniflora TaxID=39325 RepID=A0A7J7P6E0_9MAGN|nr:hypothetical protein GIB67_026494 [Kingdonia uniflora]
MTVKMKLEKFGVEKKRFRRVQNGSKDLDSDTPPRKKPRKDVFQLFADKVRDHKDLESRWAVLQETREEYFRGKGFVSLLKNHPELKDILEADKSLGAEDIANVLLSENLLVQCDRVVKTVRPRKKKLSTRPTRLEIFPDQGLSENDAFFAWTFVKRWPLWQTILSFVWPIVTLEICLLFPHGSKLIVLYTSAGLLLVIFSLLFLRSVIFGAMWIILGKRFWFFSNILVEDATLHHAPDEDARARYQKRVSDIVDDVLEWSPRLALSGMMDKPATVVNETETHSTNRNTSVSEEQVDQQDDVVEEPVYDQPEADVEVIGNEEYADHHI